ncbi:MAG: hypothetical protein A2W61_03225 [Deltaproteobacteria bacterium RIFCSPLOWO2_01_44_7]|nr:MAG: hypothetical protein A2712_02705 [Deltaproteobacteria bacterium RIFCSPHIGHO2_01_FULL_43_49]OGQ16106.1 MAG: hypothetical protein A3D22_00675 [Deltaproteobacteria bacterium RIFCSPHIGHO2_02_FULL_44_53]OGQ29067.1 MAG: hypothetical protein A3D98_04460 [Deltaproteobacteria bacterium RIFCSPHIGHO2_12_FULL_44_21]OGQ32623.1 MAG: hypothetical protein A2979_08605 [Deltaproteobacteria bacterium RIFCSPLOWO2_01_FULL_45_74]OGQ38365.1 MAG: hypothetical protein A2W61_03225 [Deltaproteobacteria bacterium 
MNNGLLAVIPARGGSKALPGKNIRPLGGLPLIAHSILMAKMCPEIDRVLVSTDDEKIADVAKTFGADVPFLRPKALAQDETPMWPVLQHVLEHVTTQEGKEYNSLLLLDPTSPGRFPEDIRKALQKLDQNVQTTGVIGVSQPEFNPIWHCVVEKEGWMEPLIRGGGIYGRRQDVPTVYRINASLYIWRSSFVRSCHGNWLEQGKYLLCEIPESRAIHIDTIHEFERTELLLKNNLISFPWMERK